MALSDAKLRALKPADKTYQAADEGGLSLVVHPGGAKTWQYRYRIGGRGAKQEKVTLGGYPDFSLADARTWRDDCRGLVQRGLSPMALRRGDPTPPTASPAAMEMAHDFRAAWCGDVMARERVEAAQAQAASTVQAFAEVWYSEMVEPANSNPRNIRRVLDKDVIPAIGGKQVAEVTVTDVLAITDRIKDRGADQMALATRNVLKRLFSFAIARQVSTFNPAAAIEAKFIATAKSRDVALTPDEVGRLLQAIYRSSMKRAQKLALHLLILCMVRKSELIEARWEEFDLTAAEWSIPADRMKKDRPHFVPLPRQAVAMLEELQGLAGGSACVFPSTHHLNRPIAHSTLNVAVRSLDVDVRDFVIHDFRRTASTCLNEAGFNSDWVEKCLAHEQKGVRGVYNRAQYASQRRDMLQWWADFVEAQIQDTQGKVIIGPFGRVSRVA